MIQVHIFAVSDFDDFVILGNMAKLRREFVREFVLAATTAGYETAVAGPDQPHGRTYSSRPK